MKGKKEIARSEEQSFLMFESDWKIVVTSTSRVPKLALFFDHR
jgi:hypothetical protein